MSRLTKLHFAADEGVLLRLQQVLKQLHRVVRQQSRAARRLEQVVLVRFGQINLTVRLWDHILGVLFYSCYWFPARFSLNQDRLANEQGRSIRSSREEGVFDLTREQ